MTEFGKEFTCLVGAKQARRALRAGTAVKLIYARDADPALTEPLVAEAEDKGVPAECVRSMRELGERCAIATKAAAAVLVRKN